QSLTERCAVDERVGVRLATTEVHARARRWHKPGRRVVRAHGDSRAGAHWLGCSVCQFPCRCSPTAWITILAEVSPKLTRRSKAHCGFPGRRRFTLRYAAYGETFSNSDEQRSARTLTPYMFASLYIGANSLHYCQRTAASGNGHLTSSGY